MGDGAFVLDDFLVYLVLADHVAADNHALDLVGALEDLEDLGVAHILLHGVVAHVAVTAQNLHALGGHAVERVGAVALGDGAQRGGAGIAGVQQGGHLHADGAAGLDGDLHVGQLGGDGLLLIDGLAHGDADLGVLGGLLQDGPHDAHTAAAHTGAALLQGLHSDLEALALLADDGGGGDMHVLKQDVAGGGLADAHFVLVLADGHAGQVGVHQEHGQAFVTQAAVHGGHHAHEIGVAGVGNKALAAIQDILAAVGGLLGGGAARARVGAGVRLGEGEGGEAAALLGPAGVAAGLVAHQGFHAPLFLLLGAGNEHGLDAQVVGAAGEAEAGIAVHQLLTDPGAGDGAHALPAILGGQIGANQAHLKRLVVGVPVQLTGTVILGGGGAYFLENEVVNHGHDIFLLLGHDETGAV